jgi:hypothetical protein
MGLSDEAIEEKFQKIQAGTGIDLQTDEEKLVAEAAEAKAEADLAKAQADAEKQAEKEAKDAQADAEKAAAKEAKASA